MVWEAVGTGNVGGGATDTMGWCIFAPAGVKAERRTAKEGGGVTQDLPSDSK